MFLAGNVDCCNPYFRYSKHLLVVLVALFGATFFVISPVLAQEDIPPEAPVDSQPVAEPAGLVDEVLPADLETDTLTAADLLNGELEDEVIIDEVILDETVTLDDLGATEANILPDSPWHRFKVVGRNIEEAFTFNPVNKAARRLENANQQLSEIQQWVDEEGVENVDPQVLGDAISYYEGKLDQVEAAAQDLKDEKTGDPSQVDGFLNELTNQQINQQKVFDNIAKEVIEIKQDAEEGEDLGSIEQIIAEVEDAKDKTLEVFSSTLVAVEDTPADVAERLNNVLASQASGKSELYELRNLELLEAFAQKVPQDTKEALALARQNTLERFEISLQALSPLVRADRFERYVEQSTSDEVHLMGLLEEIKQFAGVPPDVLEKIEKAKEIAVRKFESKLALFENDALDQRFLNSFNDGAGSLVALKEFKNRMSDSQELALIEEHHEQSIVAFKQRFNDPDSLRQAELFAELSSLAASRPTPKVFELLAALEAEVLADPEKAAFVNQLETGMERQMQDRFRQEGPQFMNRITSFDPHDMAIMERFDFEDRFIDEFAARNAEHYTDYIQDIHVPDQFDRFQERFFDAPEFVFNEIRENDAGFQDVMQFKARKMQDLRFEQERELARARLDFEEREVSHQLDRTQRQQDDQFFQSLNEVPWEEFDTRQALWEEKIDNDFQFIDQRYGEQQRIFEERLRLDPWCDVLCQEVQRLSFEQELRHQREFLADDLVRQSNQIEFDKAQFERDNPLANICDTSESCDDYCRNNPGVPGCEWAIHAGQDCPGGYWDFGINQCIYPEVGIAFVECAQGQYFDGQNCIFDPYYIAPTHFQNCGWGMHWNDQFGFCEPDFQGPYPPGPGPDCPPGEWWDPGMNRCVGGAGPDPFPPSGCGPNEFFDSSQGYCLPDCGPGYYYDDYRGCVADSNCPQGFYQDYYSNECIQECGPGEYFDHYEKRCIVDKWQECGPGLYWDPGLNECVQDHVYCPYFSSPRICAPGEQPVQPDLYDPCGQPSCIVNNVVCPDVIAEACPDGFFRDSFNDANGCWMQGKCIPYNMPPPGQICPPGEYFDYVLNQCVFDDYECFDLSVASPPYCPEGYISEIVTDANGCPGFGPCVPSGTQPPPPQGCPDIYNPVCGTDNTTYSNDCYAREAGATIQYYGSCTTQTSNCGFDQWFEPTLSLCLNNSDYVPGTAGDCSYGWTWNPTGYCDQDESIVGECSSFCTPACGGGSYCQYDQYGCATSCASFCTAGEYYDQAVGYCLPYSSNNCGNNVCDSGEDQYSCPIDCSGGEVYPGDENSCPGFAYSRWDSNNVRYCQLNSQRMCDYNYPSYLTDDGSYVAANCPVEDDTTGGWCGDYACNNGETITSCPVDCTGGTACNNNGLCDNSETPGSCPADCSGSSCPATQYNYYTSGYTCDYSVCSIGCNYDTNGCPVSCSDASSICNYNGICDNGETNALCPAECGYSGSTCNYNGTCEAGETYEGCTADCASGLNVCGNGSCEPGEDSGNCWSDCGSNTGATCPSTVFNNYTTTGACNYSNCTNGCNFDSTGCPIGCYDSTTSGYCGDGNCSGNENTNNSCPADCGAVGSSCPSTIYNNYTSTYACNYSNCPNGCNFDSLGCPDGCYDGSSTTACNYNNVCDSGESSGSCPADCSSTSSGWCGDNVCNNGETSNSCWSDCGDGNSSGVVCPSTEYNDYTTGNTCSNTRCPSGCLWDSSSCPTGCDGGSSSGGSCASDYNSCYSQAECEGAGYGWCNGNCWSSYDSSSCATPSSYCGDYVCDGNEDSSSCPSDCQPAEYCGDGSCTGSEDSYSCEQDCGVPPPPPTEEPPPVYDEPPPPVYDEPPPPPE